MKIQGRMRHSAGDRELFVLGLPGVLLLFVFAYIPMVGLIVAFKDFRYDLGFLGSKWNGLENFRFLFLSGDAWRITRNTLLLNILFIAVLLVVSVLLALVLNEMRRAAVKIYQTFMLFPFFLSWVVIGYVLLAFLDMERGFVNNLLGFFHAAPVLWYNEPKYWPAILTFANTWKNAGYLAIIYYAALITIDPSCYEAATIDGANKIQQAAHISIPLLVPVISIIVLLQLGKVLYADFGLFYQLPRDSALLYSTTDVIDTYVYRSLRKMGDIGMASAAGFYQSLVGFLLVLGSNLVVRKISPESSLF
jgi:putative aldouronate transport system permease protein